MMRTIIFKNENENDNNQNILPGMSRGEQQPLNILQISCDLSKTYP